MSLRRNASKVGEGEWEEGDGRKTKKKGKRGRPPNFSSTRVLGTARAGLGRRAAWLRDATLSSRTLSYADRAQDDFEGKRIDSANLKKLRGNGSTPPTRQPPSPTPRRHPPLLHSSISSTSRSKTSTHSHPLRQPSLQDLLL